ncbi:MAG TPA: hypothetical protein VFI22_12385, partial [Thermomicrobiales bacterium]|nr:hypothetical protein [Thermomicrobiales bacterium]
IGLTDDPPPTNRAALFAMMRWEAKRRATPAVPDALGCHRDACGRGMHSAGSNNVHLRRNGVAAGDDAS